MKNLAKPVIVLFLIAFVAAGALAFTFTNTNPRIQKLNKEKQYRGLKTIFKSASGFDQRKKEDSDFFVAKDSSGKMVGYAFDVKANGYSSDGIQMLVGIDNEGSVKGIQIIKQLETPGLGSRIEEQWFIKQFAGKKASDPIKVKTDIDAITGATISSKAVASGVRQALENFAKVGAK